MSQKKDKDGNLILDKDGNPIEVVEDTLTPEKELEKVKAENATLLQTKDTLVTEVQNLRSKNQLTKQEKDELLKQIEESKGEPTNEDGDVLKKVEELLNRKDIEARQKNKDKAMVQFISDHPEFSTSNDEAGLKKSAFDSKLSMFNIDGLNDVDEFISIYNSAYALLGKKEVVVDDTTEVVNNPTGKGNPKGENEDELSPEEIDSINKHLGGNKERYMELKKANPDAIKRLLAS